jgi:hypothetical protein
MAYANTTVSWCGRRRLRCATAPTVPPQTTEREWHGGTLAKRERDKNLVTPCHQSARVPLSLRAPCLARWAPPGALSSGRHCRRPSPNPAPAGFLRRPETDLK